MTEHDLMNSIMLAVSEAGHKIFRINVGEGFLSRHYAGDDARWFKTGVPKGYSDLSGCNGHTGTAVYIEVKTPKGKLTESQCLFLLSMLQCGANAGIAHSVDEALAICDMTDEMRQNVAEVLHGELEKIRRTGK